jgi:pentatricopeptide repeat protein
LLTLTIWFPVKNWYANNRLIQGKLSEAESTFSSMKESGCFPDVLTYTAMIKAYGDDGKILL